ncbi:MAG: WD40 repeat domain-containing protein [Planctomycetes bacterium]|nr:WD40 repeat domain-containing protein [Planctomycetota bacterium]
MLKQIQMDKHMFPTRQQCIAYTVLAGFLTLTSATVFAEGRPETVWMRGGHSLGTNDAAYSPDAARFVTAGDDKTVKVWRFSDGHLLETLHGHSQWVRAVAWSPDGQYIGSCSWDGTVRVWNPNTGEELLTINVGVAMSAVTFSSDSSMIAFGGFDNKVTVRDALTGQFVQTLTGHTDAINQIDFSADGNLIASISSDRSIRLWNVSDWSLAQVIPNAHDTFGVSLRFSPDSSLLASAGGSNAPSIKLWNPQTGGLIRSMTMGGAGGGNATGCDFSPDGQFVASARFTAGAWVFRVSDGMQINHIPTAGRSRIAPDGKTLLATHLSPTGPNAWAIFGFPDGSLVNQFVAHTSAAKAVAISADGGMVASAATFFDSAVRIWDAQDGSQTHDLHYTINSDGLSSVAFSPDGTLVAGGGSDSDGNIRVWRVSDSVLILELLHGGLTSIPGLDFSPDGSVLATGKFTGGSVRFWSMPDGGLINEITTGQVLDLEYSPDGSRLAVAEVQKIRLLDPATGLTVLLINNAHSGIVSAVDFNSDGSLLLSAGADGLLKVWSAKDGALLRTLTGHTAGVTDADISPDDSVVVSTGADATIRLWDFADGTLLQTYTDETGRLDLAVNAVVFSSDGGRFAYARADGSVVLAENPFSSILPGDVDGDGDVDLDDFSALLDCVTGPGAGVPPDCATFDFDADGDVDLFDHGAFQLAYTGL